MRIHFSHMPFFFEKKTRVRPSWVDALRVYDYSTSHERRMDGKMGQRHPPTPNVVGWVVSSRARSRFGSDDVDGCGCTYSKGFLGYERFIHRWMGWDGVGSLVSFGPVVDSPAHRGVGDPNERTSERGGREARAFDLRRKQKPREVRACAARRCVVGFVVKRRRIKKD